MIEQFEERKQYLPGLGKEMPSAYGKLADVFQYQVLEIYMEEEGRGTKVCYIPYMMNDALECYLILEGARMTGEYLRLDPEEYPVQGQLASRDGQMALIVKQGSENVFTIWFRSLEESFCCYQYHRIGHFWQEGQEQWRRLVYMVGTVYEKYQYLGDRACSSEEKEFLRLVEFAPFRFWSPIGESLDDRYPSTPEGARCMAACAREAGDRWYGRMADLYARFPLRILERALTRKLTSPRRQELYELLYEKIRKASLRYPKRDYGEELNEAILKGRRWVHSRLKKAGYTGKYPVYTRGTAEVVVTEEHPFTKMESEDFSFRIQFMVSKCRKEKQMGRNCGFFCGRGREGRIENDLEFLKKE